MDLCRKESSLEPGADLVELVQAYLEVTRAFRDRLQGGSEWDEATAAAFLRKRQQILALIEQLRQAGRQPGLQLGSSPSPKLQGQLDLIVKLEAEIQDSIARLRGELADQLRQLGLGRSALQAYRVPAGSGGGRAVDTRK